MANVEQIEQFRSGRGGNIVSICKCCGHQAWTDYYGYFACKSCIHFFINCIRKRKTFSCVRKNGKCLLEQVKRIKCHFCKLRYLYQLGMKPKMYGRHENKWYMKEVILHLRRRTARQYDPKNASMLSERNLIYKFWLRNMQKNNDWMEFVLPSAIKNRKSITLDKIIEKRGCIMIAVDESLHAHDVLICEFQYFDPYKCHVLAYQNLGIDCLNVIRTFLNCFESGFPTLEQAKNYVFLGLLP
ncbi:peroxisome proliferator-activated receptor alpha-like [Centruroides sculpturatus]|uniref:peroxisome proliferator-activated receptor alpha-like n=1 Tax=Centruroides sculpturatus TaxID=218467 RepID=UPI000C6DEAD7|nr:peroxisome proliferator-activated receptor alpha-like [Centruroides sculpturatus]